MKDILVNGFDALGIKYDDRVIERLETYSNLLREWNEKINLTAITEPEEIAVKHYLDCSTCMLTGKMEGKIIDVGTGAGFPGLVIKILNPDVKLTLLDSLNKRLIFLKEVVDTLKLEDVILEHARAEDGGHNKALREKFDVATARAVANLSTLSEYCMPFVKIGGSFISMKGPDVTDELNDSKSAINKLGGHVDEVKTVNLPNTDVFHTIISIKKLRQTPTAYPRKAGKPSKEPLK